MKKFFWPVIMVFFGVILSGCQPVPIKTIGQPDKEPTSQPEPEMASFESKIFELTPEAKYDQPILVAADEKVTFKNTSQEVVELSLFLDRQITKSLPPGAQIGFIYPSGFEKVEFNFTGHSGGNGILQRK